LRLSAGPAAPPEHVADGHTQCLGQYFGLIEPALKAPHGVQWNGDDAVGAREEIGH